MPPFRIIVRTLSSAARQLASFCFAMGTTITVFAGELARPCAARTWWPALLRFVAEMRQAACRFASCLLPAPLTSHRHPPLPRARLLSQR